MQQIPKIRSNVYIGKNIEGAVYEAGDECMKVNLKQTVVWFEKNRVMFEEREVIFDTEIAIYKKWFTVPGNIIKSYTLEYLPGCYEVINSKGDPIETSDGNQVYCFYYYSGNSKHQPYGELTEEQTLIDFLLSVSSE